MTDPLQAAGRFLGEKTIMIELISAVTAGFASGWSQLAQDPVGILSPYLAFPGVAIHLASITIVLAYLFRNQVYLRFTVIVGQLLYVVFYTTRPSGVLWEPVFWNGLIAATNMVMIYVILRERSDSGLSVEERKLMTHFSGLTPGELRRAIRIAEWVTVDADTTIIHHGQRPEYVYFLMEGRAEITRNDRNFDVTQGIFLGEISHLLQRPATATVTVKDGTRYLRWKGDDLARIMDNNAAIDRAFSALFNRDLAAKVAAG